MTNRYATAPVIMLLLSLVILSGCSQPEVAGDAGRQVRAPSYSIVATGDPDADLGPVSTFSWMPDRQARRDNPYLGGMPASNFIERAIYNTLTAKGYRFSGAPDSQGLMVDYRVALGNPLEDERLSRRHGVQPGLQAGTPDASRYEKGTLVVNVVDNSHGRTVWSSALQGFADLDIPAHVRQQRINEIVARMLAGFPDRPASQQ